MTLRFAAAQTAHDTSKRAEDLKQERAQRELNAVVAEAMLATGLCEPGGLSTSQIARLAEHIQTTPELTNRVSQATAELYAAQLPIGSTGVQVFDAESEDFQFRRILRPSGPAFQRALRNAMPFRSRRTGPAPT